MANEFDTLLDLTALRREEDESVRELERLVACYELASADDRRVVWAVLNKYAPFIIF